MLSLSRKLLIACLLVAGMTGVGFAQTGLVSVTATSAKGHFQVVVRGEPKFIDEDGMHGVSYVPENSGMGYFVLSKEMPAEMVKALDAQGITTEARIDAVTQGCLTGMNAKATAERAATSSGVAGKEFLFETAGGAHGVTRCFIAGGRVYQLIVIWSGTAPAASDVNSFFDSFVIES